MANETTRFLIERDGAGQMASQIDETTGRGLIEPVPRVISSHEQWLVNLGTGRIETASPLMLSLGDTIYVEYEPTEDEVRRLKRGQAVSVTMQMLARLKARDRSITERMALPQSVVQEQRARRYIDLHGAPPASAGETAATAPAPAPAPAEQAFGGFSLPAEASPAVNPGLASAFSLGPLPAST